MKDNTYEFADDLISKAVAFAVSAHSGQYRKDGKTPAIIHAMEAAVNAASLTSDIEVMAAALLHDTIEDTDVTPEQIQKMFGDRVFNFVNGDTEDKHKNMTAEESWKIRKNESLNALKNETDINVKILWLSDKLSNIRSFYRAYREVGDKMWDRFNQKDPLMHEWYYRTVAENITELKDTVAYEEYCELVDKLFSNYHK